MGKQAGLIQIDGTVGNVSFYKSKDGYMARIKAGVKGERIQTDAAFARTRENNAEFARATAASLQLRTALSNAISQVKDRKMATRLFTQMMIVVKADATNDRGLRNVLDGELELLHGFEFNAASPLISTFNAPYTSTIDRAAGTLAVSIPPYVPGDAIKPPTGATHYALIAAGALVDFTADTYVGNVKTSDVLALGTAPTVQLDLSAAVTAASTAPLFLAFGILFYQQVNGKNYPLKNGAFNGMSLVKVLGV